MHSAVNVTTDLNLTGMVAQYGRASGLMKEIAGAIMGQFAENLRREIERTMPAAPPVDAAAASAGSDLATAAAPAVAAVREAAATTANEAPRTTPAAVPISAFSILWIALKNWIGGLFGRKSG